MSTNKKTKNPAKTSAKAPAMAAQTEQRRLKPFEYGILAVCAGLIGFGIWQAVAGNGKTTDGTCAQVGREYQVSLKSDAFSPADISVNRCDRIVISNNGAESYDLMLGTRDSHLGYPGFDGQMLRQGEYFTFDAVKTGSFPMHDHIRDNAKLQITVNQ